MFRVGLGFGVLIAVIPPQPSPYAVISKASVSGVLNTIPGLLKRRENTNNKTQATAFCEFTFRPVSFPCSQWVVVPLWVSSALLQLCAVACGFLPRRRSDRGRVYSDFWHRLTIWQAGAQSRPGSGRLEGSQNGIMADQESIVVCFVCCVCCLLFVCVSFRFVFVLFWPGGAGDFGTFSGCVPNI